MRHLTKEINRLGRQIAIRVLSRSGEFENIDGEEAMSAYFVEAKYRAHNMINPQPVALKILVKASREIDGVDQFQIDEDVVKRIDDFQVVSMRRVILVLVDTRASTVSYEFYDMLFETKGYEWGGVKFPWREPNRLQGPVWWNCCFVMRDAGEMTENERDRLIVLRTKNAAPKNQKSIFDK